MLYYAKLCEMDFHPNSTFITLLCCRADILNKWRFVFWRLNYWTWHKSLGSSPRSPASYHYRVN